MEHLKKLITLIHQK